VNSHQREAVDVVHLDGGADDLEKARQHAHLHPGLLHPADHVEDVIRVRVLGCDHDPMHVMLDQ
jgi:hypothetical protein